jgi:hypothetical protein
MRESTELFAIVRGVNAKCDCNHSRQANSKATYFKYALAALPAFRKSNLRFVLRRKGHMKNVPAVETAKSLLTEALGWSVMKWLREKRTVRKIADEANVALDQLNQAVKGRWPDDVRTAYDLLMQQSRGNGKVHARKDESNSSATKAQIILIVKKVKEADDDARKARMDAEETFDIAEKQLSTALAREGCRKAIRSWELHETAIRKAEAVIPSR